MYQIQNDFNNFFPLLYDAILQYKVDKNVRILKSTAMSVMNELWIFACLAFSCL